MSVDPTESSKRLIEQVKAAVTASREARKDAAVGWAMAVVFAGVVMWVVVFELGHLPW